MKLNSDTIYTGDNGRVFCGKHAGATAKANGVGERRRSS